MKLHELFVHTQAFILHTKASETGYAYMGVWSNKAFPRCSDVSVQPGVCSLIFCHFEL